MIFDFEYDYKYKPKHFAYALELRLCPRTSCTPYNFAYDLAYRAVRLNQILVVKDSQKILSSSFIVDFSQMNQIFILLYL